LQLLRVERTQLDHDPVLLPAVADGLQQIIAERKQADDLLQAGLHPTKSVLFTGPPGVGKTMAARWLAAQLHLPLLVLDLTAVMSSYLGKTGNNVRYVLDYAKSRDCILLLDELDAIAKRRDDISEIGELKRLVTVLLQEIDDWPPTGLLLAATNHPDLLDPAVWRRFEMVLPFPLPTAQQIAYFVQSLLEGFSRQTTVWSEVLSLAYQGRSFSEIERDILIAKRNSIVHHIPLDAQLKQQLRASTSLPRGERVKLANVLIENNITSQREANEITGIARNTIRKYSPAKVNRK
jgi:SpoVK/Ycf46/Vps4 family AAA+-type ATPase